MASCSWSPRGLLGLFMAVLVLAGCGSPPPMPEASAVVLGSDATLTVAVTPGSHVTAAARVASPTATLQATMSAAAATSAPTEAPTSVRAAPSATALPGPTRAAAPPTTAPTRTSTAEPSAAGPTPLTTVLPPTATSPLPVPTITASPAVHYFRITPTTTLNLGDRLTMSWEAAGQKAELCPISGPGPVETRCQDVPLAGSTHFVTDEDSMAYVGFGLRVTAGGSSTWSLVNVHLQCQNLRTWFFADAPLRCPEALVHKSYAAGQYFERGLMVWLQDPDSFYVFYRGRDEQGFQTFDWITDIRQIPGASPDRRIGEQAPSGLYEPVSGFGMVWRGEIGGVRPDVRQQLGWAVGPEFGFDASLQCETPTYPGMWHCYLRGPRGEILDLRPDSTAQVRWLWEERPSAP